MYLTRSELLQLRLRQFKIPDETFHLLKSNGIFRTRGVRSGQAVRNHKHNIAISHVQRKPDNTKPGERGVNLHNLCSVKHIKENKQPSKAPGGLEILHLNIRSLKNRAHLLELRTTCSWKEKRHHYNLWNMAQYHRHFSRDTNRRLQITQVRSTSQRRWRSMCLCPQRSQVICTEGVVIDIRAKFPSALDKCPVQETKINNNLRDISPRRLSSEFLRRST